MYDEEQTMHIRKIFCFNNNFINNQKKQKSKKEILSTCFLFVIISVISQYAIDVISKILQRLPMSEWFKVTFSYKVYYAAVITAFINGLLSTKLNGRLFAISAVIVATTIYQTILYLTDEETQSNIELVYSIIRDIFLILLILYIIDRLFNVDENKTEEEVDTTNAITITIVASIVINLATFLSRSAYSVIEQLIFPSNKIGGNIFIYFHKKNT